MAVSKTFVNNHDDCADVLVLQVGALANAVGIGGGAFFVPLFNILLGFSEHRVCELCDAAHSGAV